MYCIYYLSILFYFLNLLIYYIGQSAHAVPMKNRHYTELACLC